MQVVVLSAAELQSLIKQAIAEYEATKPAAAPDIELIGPEELCRRLGISIPTQITLRKKGKLPYMDLGSKILYNWIEVVSAIKHKKP